MYDNSRVPSYTNVSSRPCRVQYSRWSLETPTTEAAINQTLTQPTAMLSSSFYFAPTQRAKPVLTPNYVNFYPPSSSSTTHLSNNQRPKSTFFRDSTSTNQSTFHVND